MMRSEEPRGLPVRGSASACGQRHRENRESEYADSAVAQADPAMPVPALVAICVHAMRIDRWPHGCPPLSSERVIPAQMTPLSCLRPAVDFIKIDLDIG